MVNAVAGADICPSDEVDISLPHPTDVVRGLGWYRHGRRDPTTRLHGRAFERATYTPDGPGTLRIDWVHARDGVTARARGWGPGGPWLSARAGHLLGASYEPPAVPDGARSPVVAGAARRFRDVRTGASATLYHELLPTVIAQRITGGEANLQWLRLCHSLGEAAPGPLGLLLPPRPELLARTPAWRFHRLGIEAKRAEALRRVGRHAGRFWAWAADGSTAVAGRLRLLPGIGPWTVGSVLGPALGDDDAVAVGDFHHPNTVSWALAGEARGDDDRMLELLEPFAGQRGRIIRMLGMCGYRAPAFGPRKRIVPIRFM